MYALAQDGEGFLWVGTQNGLNRYDGRTFRHEWTSGGQPSPVGFGFIRTLFVDASGRLWVGVDAHGAFVFDRRGEEFRRVPLVEAEGEGAQPEIVWDFVTLGETVVVATSLGLARAHTADAEPRLEPWTPDGWPPECGAATSAVWAASDTDLWIGTVAGCLLRYDRAAGERVRLLAELGDVVREMSLESGGGVWVTVDGRGAFLFDRSGGLLAGPGEPTAATSGARQVLTSATGETWIATPRGLAWARGEGRDTTWFGMGTREAGALPHEYVSALFEDRQGVLWVGTWNGLAHAGPFRRGIGFIPAPPSTGNTTPGGIVAIETLGGGRLALGTLGGGLLEVSLDDSSATAVDHPPMSDVYSLAVGPDGDLWIASNGSGLLRRSGRGWRAYRAGVAGPGGAFDDGIAAVTVDRAGVVWAGSARSGLGRYDPLTDRFERFPGPLPGGTYAAIYVWPVVEDREGALWVGANGPEGGIHRLSPDRSWFSTFVTGSPEHPNGGRVLTLLPARDGVVWFGTQGGGLGRLDPATGEARFYTDADGLPHNNVEGILQDGSGMLWVSTNDGLARFDPTSERFWIFRDPAGAEANRFFANAAHALTDGRMLFGGPNGITVVDPRSIVPPEHAPPVALTGFRVRGAERPDVNSVTAQDGLELAPDENFFAIDLAVLDFTGVRLHDYRYRLDGLDPDWMEVSEGGTASYTSVPPGRYTFRVEARTGDGLWSQAGLTMPIVVHPPFYATWWFRLAAVALLVVALRVAYAARISQLARVRAMRLRITGDLHDDIGANLSAIALKSELIQRPNVPPGKRQRALEDIERLARETTQTVREMIWVVKEEHDSTVGLIDRMRDSATTLLGGVIEYTIDVDDDVPERPISMELRQDVYRIFKEMLQNVLKHAQATRVEITLRYARGRLIVSVADNGVGFGVGGASAGNGLGLMRGRAEKHGGTLDLSSTRASGTRVTLDVAV